MTGIIVESGLPRAWAPRASIYADNLFNRRNELSVTPSFSPPGTNNNGDEVLVDRPLTVGLWLRYSVPNAVVLRDP
jgi:hypothetical protein